MANPSPPLTLPGFPLRPGRMHEVSGPGATAFACIIAAGLDGPVIWARERWLADHIHPPGIHGFFDPARLLLAETRDQSETLAVAEDALRDGSAPLVLAEITKPLNLTEGRRLQLAAQAGRATGLCLIPEDMGSNAAETRWQCSPVFDPDGLDDSTLFRWRIIKNKSGTIGAWDVRWDAAARRLDVVSSAGD